MMRTAAAITCGSTPYSWTERGYSSSAKDTMSIVAALRSTNARLVVISETYSPAPDSLHSRRNARFVIPAIGANTTGGSMT